MSTVTYNILEEDQMTKQENDGELLINLDIEDKSVEQKSNILSRFYAELVRNKKMLYKTIEGIHMFTFLWLSLSCTFLAIFFLVYPDKRSSEIAYLIYYYGIVIILVSVTDILVNKVLKGVQALMVTSVLLFSIFFSEFVLYMVETGTVWILFHLHEAARRNMN